MNLSDKLVPDTHPLLKTKLELFDFKNPAVDPAELGNHMIEMLDKYNGIGLSANQLGMNYRVFVMRTEPRLVCFNPTVTFQSDEQVVLEEGCLTYPMLYVRIKRSSWIRAKFMDVNGQLHTEKFGGITARCFLHELDHLNGMLYLNRASKINIERAKRKLKLLKRRQKRLIDTPMIKTSEEVV